MLGIGIWVLVDNGTIQTVMARIPTNSVFSSSDLDNIVSGTSYLKTAAIGFCVAGGIMFLIGFCGCCGAIKENKCMLGIVSNCYKIFYKVNAQHWCQEGGGFKKTTIGLSSHNTDYKPQILANPSS